MIVVDYLCHVGCRTVAFVNPAGKPRMHNTDLQTFYDPAVRNKLQNQEESVNISVMEQPGKSQLFGGNLQAEELKEKGIKAQNKASIGWELGKRSLSF